MQMRNTPVEIPEGEDGEEAWTNFVVEGRGREQKRATHEPI